METFQKKELSKSIRALPMFVKEKLNLGREILPMNFYKLNEKQAIINCLVSQYDYVLPYNYITNEYKKINISPIVLEPDNNLVMNVRNTYGENVAKYIFGYKNENKSISKDKHYFFSKISNSMKNKNMADNIFLDESNYSDEIIILEELKRIAKKNNFLLILPLVIKYWSRICDCTNVSMEIKNAILNDLEAILDIPKYKKLIQDLPVSEYYVVPNWTTTDKKESLACLLTHFLTNNYLINSDFLMDDSQIGKMLTTILGNENMESLNISLPPSRISCVNNNPFKNNSKIAPSIQLPTQNVEKFLFIQELGNKTKVIPDIFKNNISQEMGNKTKAIPQEPENINKLEKGFSTLLKGIIGKLKGGGCENNEDNTYQYCDKTDVATTDTSSFRDEEIKYRGIILPSLIKNNTSTLSNITSLKYKLFSYCKINSLTDNKEITNRLERLLEIFKNNPNHYFLEYNYKDYISETFVICGENDSEILEAYRLYFEINSIIMNKLSKDYKTIFEVPREFLELTACNVLVALNNFGFYNFKNLIVFREYMEEFYNLASRLNNETTPILSLHNSIQEIIEIFFRNTDILIGGATDNVYEFDNKFDFWKHAYLLDALSYPQENQMCVTKTNELFNTMSDYELFWSGITKERYEEFSTTQKFILQRYCLTFFVNNDKEDGSKIIFENTCNQDDRVCFLAKMTGDNISTLDFLKKMSEKIEKENDSEIDLIDFSDKVENTFGSNVIITQDKLKYIDDPKKISPYISHQTQETEKINTILESTLFFFNLLEKLGYTITKDVSKTNIVAQISPALTISKIKELISKNGSEKEGLFLEKMESLLNQILENDNNSAKGGSINRLSLLLPNNHDINFEEGKLENDLILHEMEELEDGLEKLTRTNSLTIDNVYRLIPYFIKDQIKISNSLDFDVLQSNQRGGALPNEEPENVFEIFLKKAKEVSDKIKNNKPIATKEELEKSVDKFVQEKYINSLDYIVPYLDNKIRIGTQKDKEYYLLKQTLNSIEYLRKNYNTDFDQNVKNRIYELYLLKESFSIFVYNLYIITQYIKHVTEELYNSTKIMPEKKVIDLSTLNGMRSLIKEKMDKVKNEKLGEKNVEYINKNLDSKFERTKDFKENVEKAFDEFFSKD